MVASQGDVTDEDLRTAVKELTQAGTQEVADRVGLSRQAVDHRLQQIAGRRQRVVWSKKIGPTKVWLHSMHVAPR